MKNNELINLLEEDMHGDLKSMDSPSDKEVDISIDEVKGWYFEAEKLISVLRNILDAPMTQSINQLRYAGHHILKAQTDKDEEITQSNLVEAFKHCKRAVYDAIDLYVYKFNNIYTTLMPYLAGQRVIKLEQLFYDHIKAIHETRNSSVNRIDYYAKIQKILIDGLKLIEQINEFLRETGISKKDSY